MSPPAEKSAVLHHSITSSPKLSPENAKTRMPLLQYVILYEMTHTQMHKSRSAEKSAVLHLSSFHPAKLQFMVWAPWAPWALGSGLLGSGLWARRPGLQSLLGSRDYWAPWAPKQESALSL